MSFNSDFDPTGAAYNDEHVQCNIPVTINGNSRYAGYLMEFPGAKDELVNAAQTTYGAWTAVSKGGTRYTIAAAGDPGVNGAVVDFTTGRVAVRTDGQDLYFRYLRHGRIYQRFDSPFARSYPGYLDAESGNLDLFDDFEFDRGAGFRGGQITLAQAPDEEITFRVQTASGEGSQYEDIPIASGAYTSEMVTFSDRLKFQPEQHLRVTLLQTTAPGSPSDAYIYLEPG